MRGKLLKNVVRWLDRAAATTYWEGNTGPSVELQQGLRQGCVLSPILYCGFVNMQVKRYKDLKKEVPQELQMIAKVFMHQGLQPIMQECGESMKTQGLGGRTGHAELGKPGVSNKLGKDWLLAFLFMDDTAHIAEDEQGLEQQIAAHANFCRKFRMRTNVNKSKVMHFHKTQEPKEWQLIVGDQVYKSPKVQQGDRIGTGADGNAKYEYRDMSQKQLGVLLDTKLNGRAHARRCKAKAIGYGDDVVAIQAALGERAALQYVKSTVTPAVTFGLEVIPKEAAQILDRTYQETVAKAVGVHRERSDGDYDVNPKVKGSSVLWETQEPRWSVLRSKKQIAMCAKVRTNAKKGSTQVKGKLVSTIVQARDSQGKLDRTMREAGETAMAWGVQQQVRDKPTQPIRQVQDWKKKVAGAAWKEEMKLRKGELKCREPTAEGIRQSTKLYVEGVKQVGSQLGPWEGWVKDRKKRVGVRKKTMGAIHGLLSHCKKGITNFNRLDLQERTRLLECPCGTGVQDAYHVMVECPRLQSTREEVKKQVVEKLREEGDQGRVQVAEQMQASEMSRVLLGAVDGSVGGGSGRQVAATVWDRKGADQIRELMEENVSRRQEIRDAVKVKMGERKEASRQQAMGCQVVCVEVGVAGVGNDIFSVTD